MMRANDKENPSYMFCYEYRCHDSHTFEYKQYPGEIYYYYCPGVKAIIVEFGDGSRSEDRQ